MARPSLSLLLFTDTMSLRADFNGTELIAINQRPPGDKNFGESLTDSIEFLINLGPKRLGKQVLILTSQSWSQIASLPRVNSSTLSNQDLIQSLKFEAESFSGIEAMQSSLDFVEVKGTDQDRNFYVTQYPNGNTTFLQGIIDTYGGELIGITTPYALSAALDSKQDQPFQRIEFWKNSVCCLSQNGMKNIAIANIDPKSDRWQSLVEASGIDLQNTTECIVESGLGIPSEFLPDNSKNLDDEAVLKQWLTLWAKNYDSGSVPLLRPPAKPVSEKKKLTGAVLVAAIMLIGCITHYIYLSGSLSKLEGQLKAKNGPAEKKKLAEGQLKKIVAEQKQLDDKMEAVRLENSTIKKLVSKRDRVAYILRSIAELGSPNLIIASITPQSDGLTLIGESIASDAATQLARGLRKSLIKAGWEVQAPTQTGNNQLTNGGPWQFKIQLVDVELPSVAPNPSDSNNAQVQ
ncbi:MAG: hypothetical protein VX438_03155 [Planctomycetota bacterium]|nr:hypothetical protein [Planctomycetota bacterium]